MKNNLDTIIIKFLKDEISEEENLQLQEWIAESESNKILFQKLTSGNWLDGEVKKLYGYNEAESWNRIKAGIAVQSPKVITMKRSWYMVAAAAMVLVLAGIYFLNSEKRTLPGNKISIAKNKDVEAPKATKAMIQMGNGKLVLLDSINSGTLAEQGNIKVLKQANGDIVYTGDATEISYNTLVNPIGSKVVNITMQDGTIVWLNSGSSLKYPTMFSGEERKVELTGEAYFEVAHNAAMPFKVNVAGKEEVEVLGTHFNINSYDDEPSVKTTLLEGSVKVSKGLASIMIKPEEQAVVSDKDNNIAVKQGVDIDEVIAWKNGKFNFQNSDLTSIMRQLQRWYNVTVKYQGNIPTDEFVGIISRDVNISEILKMLKKTSLAKFEINGNEIIVK